MLLGVNISAVRLRNSSVEKAARSERSYSSEKIAG